MLGSSNEWSPLKEVIVGSIKRFNQYTHYSGEQRSNAFLIPIMSEVIEGLQTFQNLLEKEGVKVYRPNGFCYNVRDCATVLGNTILEAPMQYEIEHPFQKPLKSIFMQKWLEGMNWISAPEPTWIDRGVHEPLFDGANICRLDKTLLVALNQTANQHGLSWLKRQFPKYNIEETILNSDISHIDTSISPISSNTVLINSDRYTQSTIPDTFKDWNQIWIEGNDLIEEPIVNGMMSVASKWVGMNTLSLNETTLFVNECQVNLIEKLEQNNFNCIPVPLKHTRELGGGLHCCTLDLVRD